MRLAMVRQILTTCRRLLIAECILLIVLLTVMLAIDTWWMTTPRKVCFIELSPKSINFRSRCDAPLLCSRNWSCSLETPQLYVGVFPIDIDDFWQPIAKREIDVGVSTRLILAVFSVLPIVSAIAPLIRITRMMRNRCRGCGYDVRMHSAGICPECGLSVHTVRSLWKARFWTFAKTWGMVFIFALIISSLATCWVFSKCGVIQPVRFTTSESPEKIQETPTPPIDRSLEPNPNCAMADTWLSVLFPDLPMEKISFSSIRDRYRQDAATLKCNDRYPLILVGKCGDGKVLFLKRSEGYGARTLYFEAESERLIGATANSDVHDVECKGIGFWREEIVCENYEVIEAICGTLKKAGDKGELAMPLTPRKRTPGEASP